MSDFLPSDYSYGADESPATGTADTGWISAAISAAGAIASTSIGAAATKKHQERAAKQAKQAAKDQAEIVGMQTQLAAAQTQANTAAALIEGMASKKTLYVVGGFVLLGGLTALTVLLLKRGVADA